MSKNQKPDPLKVIRDEIYEMLCEKAPHDIQKPYYQSKLGTAFEEAWEDYKNIKNPKE